MRGTIGAPLLMFPTAWAKSSEEYVHKVESLCELSD